MELQKNELVEITGGAITTTWINSINKIINTIYELGKETGSSIRRLIYGSYCPIN